MSDLSPIQTYDEAMAEAVALGLMTAGGTATDRCQCPTCGRVFSTDPNFMRHLNPDRYRAGFDKSLNCLDPAGVGLVTTALPSGVLEWHRPGSDTPVEARFGLRGDGGTDAGVPGQESLEKAV